MSADNYTGMTVKRQLSDLFDSKFDGIYRYFLIKTLDQSVAEDLSSETFTRLGEQLHINQSIDNAESYLYGIARNVLNEHLREKYLLADISLDENRIEDAVEEAGTRTMTMLEDALRRCLERLPEKQALVLRLRFVERLSFQEIITELGKTADYVKTTQRRAIASMRKLVAGGECIPALTYKKHE
ncbi:MAG: RNA polymerase sigma factor YlaC [candidate division WS6 bacterium OLB20]|uniref:RNA polymerase sigma factor YlaC n=1 Tax=candidate division WS6 bacterium OLB20 TaxID=1617426 RepID=A0A136LYW6_9BACT|nr:MAG: RNA polymerase sigma factor YlaC [candidate division WS6 bacterium OLB20]